MSDEKDKNNIITLAVSNKDNKDNKSEESPDLFSETLSNYLEKYKETEFPGAAMLIWYENSMDPDSLKMAVNSEDIPLLHYMSSKISRHLEDVDLSVFDYEPENNEED